MIGFDFWTGGGVTAKQVIADLEKLNAARLHVRINSPGGDAFEGSAIYNALRRFDGEVVTHIDGLAASAAATIAMAGEQIEIAENAFLMIHKAWAITLGNDQDHSKTAELLAKLDDSIANIYAQRSGKSAERVLQLMDEETWMNSAEAKRNGFVDAISEKAAAQNSFDLSVFDHAPETLLAQPNSRRDGGRSRNKRQIEDILRDEGFSNSEAKAAVSRIFEASQRDAEDSRQREAAAVERAVAILSK